MKRFLLILVIFGLAGFAIYNNIQAQSSAAMQKPQVGYNAPHFTLKGLDDQTYQVTGPRDKPLVINFWASWCGPCKMEAPDLEKLYGTYKDQVDFYAINITKSDKLDSAKQFVSQFKLTMPILLDTDAKVSDTYQVKAIPTTFLVDKQGVIRRSIIGMVDAGSFEQELKKIVTK
ncbi:TlpA family protein disulfide reductase [Brevibacillus massiliensis]|jgi:thiol-disulfide isomerase/thioredoxin|uniref:TlpA family protein disulfide reductase n=1 Tax=Brevibacillus massiliensis TaxID=1118054 RepID=UPI00030EF58D|nr:TlpA disulfide reductase family protein [Brevibacillus massiliensis]